MVYYIVSGLLLMFLWCPCRAINVNVAYIVFSTGFIPQPEVQQLFNLREQYFCYDDRSTLGEFQSKRTICAIKCADRPLRVHKVPEGPPGGEGVKLTTSFLRSQPSSRKTYVSTRGVL